MRNQTDRMLLLSWLGSTALYALIVVTFLLDIGIGYPVNLWLSLTVSVAPAFCLQLLLCRRERRWVKFLPLLLLALLALWLWIMSQLASGWDALGWLILLLLCIAPAVGFAAGWAAYGLQKIRRKGSVHG